VTELDEEAVMARARAQWVRAAKSPTTSRHGGMVISNT
jgi:hypothetical protein